ncbi:unnamed protein product [Ranitomeya imitator]|uniref:Uncharacterized protein n=1 Tax=Ranitomeya imitator TaxID=111125 RepID=A0ABN9KS39_9NEOB|nr:unnamed protein product [Ranitomeya imitator]
MAADVNAVQAAGAQFSSPPVKMLAARLTQCKKRPGPSFWLEQCPGGGELEVSVVWMQGSVIQVRPERGTTLRLTDDSHTFTVCAADKVPKGKPCLEQGGAIEIKSSSSLKRQRAYYSSQRSIARGVSFLTLACQSRYVTVRKEKR